MDAFLQTENGSHTSPMSPPVMRSTFGASRPPGVLAFNVTIGPLWGGDSKALAYLSPSGWVTVEMTGNPATPFGEPQPFLAKVTLTGPFDITSDFQRVLAAQA